MNQADSGKTPPCKGAPPVGPRFFKKRSDHIGNLLKIYFETGSPNFKRDLTAKDDPPSKPLSF